MYRPEITGTVFSIEDVHKEAFVYNGNKINEQDYGRVQLEVRDKSNKRQIVNVRLIGEVPKTFVEDAKVSIVIQSFKVESDLCSVTAKVEDITIHK